VGVRRGWAAADDERRQRGELGLIDGIVGIDVTGQLHRAVDGALRRRFDRRDDRGLVAQHAAVAAVPAERDVELNVEEVRHLPGPDERSELIGDHHGVRSAIRPVPRMAAVAAREHAVRVRLTVWTIPVTATASATRRPPFPVFRS
jgi:hypothetical protein